MKYIREFYRTNTPVDAILEKVNTFLYKNDFKGRVKMTGKNGNDDITINRPTTVISNSHFYSDKGIIWFTYIFSGAKNVADKYLKKQFYQTIANELEVKLKSLPEIKGVKINATGSSEPMKMGSKIYGSHPKKNSVYEVICHLDENEILKQIEQDPTRYQEWGGKELNKWIDIPSYISRGSDSQLWGIKTFEAFIEEDWTTVTWVSKVANLFSKLSGIPLPQLRKFKNVETKDEPTVFLEGNDNVKYKSAKTGYWYFVQHQSLHEYRIKISAKPINWQKSFFTIGQDVNLVELKSIEEYFQNFENGYFEKKVEMFISGFKLEIGTEFKELEIFHNGEFTREEVSASFDRLPNEINNMQSLLGEYSVLQYIYNLFTYLIKKMIFTDVLTYWTDELYDAVKNYCEEHPEEYVEYANKLKIFLPEELIEELSYLTRSKKINMWDMKMAMAENLMGYESDEERYDDEYNEYNVMTIEMVQNAILKSVEFLVDRYCDESDEELSDKVCLEGCSFANELVLVYIENEKEEIESMMDDFVRDNIGFGFSNKEDGEDSFKMVFDSLLKEAKKKIKNIVKMEPVEAGKFAKALEYYAKIKVPENLKRAGNIGLLGYEVH